MGWRFTVCGNTIALDLPGSSWTNAVRGVPPRMLDPYFKRAFPLKHAKKQVYWLAREYPVLRDARAVCFTSAIERDSAAKTFWPRRWHPAVVSFGLRSRRAIR